MRKLAALGIGLFVGRNLARKVVDITKTLTDPHTKTAGQTLVGQTCVITTGYVNETFGQAIYDDGAGDYILQVRAQTPNPLERRQRVSISSYDPTTHTYSVTDLV